MTQPGSQKILLVDDDEYILALFQEILEPENCVIVQAHDGVEALDKFDKYQPDLVLLDLMLPRLNGYEVCSRIRRNPLARHVPIIMLSGMGDREAKLRALEVGVDDFLAKPVESVELIGRVRGMLTLHQCRQTNERQQGAIEAARAAAERLHQLMDELGRHHAVQADTQLGALIGEATATCKRLDQALV